MLDLRRGTRRRRPTPTRSCSRRASLAVERSLARARPRHLGDPRPAAPPRALQGHVLDDGRPRASRCSRRWVGVARPDWEPLRDEIAADVLSQRLTTTSSALRGGLRPARDSTPRRCSSCCAVCSTRRRPAGARRRSHADRGRAAYRPDRLPLPLRRRPARRRGRHDHLHVVAGRGVRCAAGMLEEAERAASRQMLALGRRHRPAARAVRPRASRASATTRRPTSTSV